MQQEIQYLQPDALISVEIGAGYIQRLQKLSLFLLENRSDEELQTLQSQLHSSSVEEDSYGYHYETVAMLIKTAEMIAKDKGLLESRSVDFTAADNLPGSPAQGQPE